MPRRIIAFQAGSYYHLYNRGVNKEAIFFEAENYTFFLRRLREYFTADVATVIAYCLMPNHYHLLVHLLTDDLASIMGAFSLSYAKAINKRYERVGPLFQGRFEGKLVHKDEYLLHLSRYIHLNPVVAGLAHTPEDWAFSSYRDYIGLRTGTLPQAEVVLVQFRSSRSHIPGVSETSGMCERAAYRKFVEAYCDRDTARVKDLLFDE